MPHQVTLWDLLGTPPVEMRKPAPPAILPLASTAPEPAFPPFTAEDLAALQHLGKALCHGYGPAHDSLWSAYICKGAVHTCLEVPLPAQWRDLGCTAVVRVTRTRLGWTSGFWLQGYGYSRGRGGFHHPNQDLMGPFLWPTRQAAVEDGASWLRDACQEKPLARAIAEYFAARGIDALGGPHPNLMRRLLTREELAAIEKRGPSAEDLALVDPGPSESLLAFERAIGVTEDDMPPPVLSRVRMPA
ncbi:hypothetical protein [Methylorubrum thiocyanatum]|uniref:hypothetical protein n=1 Tax=Methylorubrum thiocyanatum TaxID=47958 RepID=UPI00398C7AB5